MDNIYFFSPAKQEPLRKRIALGLIELILWACAVLGVFTAAMLIVFTVMPKTSLPCDNPRSFECLDHRVQECVASEAYTKDQCVILIGGNK